MIQINSLNAAIGEVERGRQKCRHLAHVQAVARQSEPVSVSNQVGDLAADERRQVCCHVVR